MEKKIKIFVKGERELPFYATDGAAGADICAKLEESVFLNPLEIKIIPTGLFVSIPNGYEIQVRPRSGLAAKNGVTVLNTPGTIDSDYRGEICVILINHGKETFEVKDGMRIAQIVVAKVTLADFERAEELTLTARADRGFGHTGV
jgi:dUTP pyrophosphatase